MALEGKIPKVNWPDRSGTYKIIQLELDGTKYLRFPKDSLEFMHYAILKNFLEEQKVGYNLIQADQGGGREIPSPIGERYKIVGMGKSEINLQDKTSRFYDISMDYKIGINEEHLESIKKDFPEWKFKY